MVMSLLFADSIHIREQAKVDAARITQKSGNELRGSNTALQQFSASLANKRRLAAAGSAVNDLSGNSARVARAFTSGRLSSRIAAAEELGMVTAQAAAAGVGGSVVDLYKETLQLHDAMRSQQLERSLGEQQWAVGQQKANTVQAAIAGLDNNNYRANLDYTQYLDHKKPSFLEQVVGIAGTVAATYFGGPQAGAAVAGAFEGIQSIRNGDFAAGGDALMGAVQNGMGAVRTAQALAPGPAPAAAPAASPSGGSLSLDTISSGTDRFFNIPAPQWGSVTLR